MWAQCLRTNCGLVCDGFKWLLRSANVKLLWVLKEPFVTSNPHQELLKFITNATYMIQTLLVNTDMWFIWEHTSTKTPNNTSTVSLLKSCTRMSSMTFSLPTVVMWHYDPLVHYLRPMSGGGSLPKQVTNTNSWLHLAKDLTRRICEVRQ